MGFSYQLEIIKPSIIIQFDTINLDKAFKLIVSSNLENLINIEGSLKETLQKIQS